MTYKGYELTRGTITHQHGTVTGVLIDGNGRHTIAYDLDLAKRFVDGITKGVKEVCSKTKTKP